MLDWKLETAQHTSIYLTEISATDETSLRKSCEAAAAKAVSLLHENIMDDSLYLLFEWSPARLCISVTDASKTTDSPSQVQCLFSGILAADANAPEFVDTLKFWLHDFLASCTDFFSYSLVAAFTRNGRLTTELL